MTSQDVEPCTARAGHQAGLNSAGRTRVHRHLGPDTHVCAHAHGGGKALRITLAPAMHSGSRSRAHLDTLTLTLPELRAGGGAGALQARKTHGSSARPAGLAADARGYFKPGSMGDFW